MADLATLKIAVDSRPVENAANDLDALAASAGRADRAAAGLTSTAKTTSAAAAGMSNAMRQAQAAQEAAAQAMGGVAGSGRLAGHQIQNLAFQFQDLGVQLASGGPPLTAFIQQGSQISGIMMQAGIGVGGLAREVVGMVGGFLKAHPILLAISVAAGVVGTAMNFMASDISKATGVSVTTMDVLLGAFDVVRNYVGNVVTKAFEYFGTTAGAVWESVVAVTRRAINIIIGLVSIVPRSFIEAFRVIPEAIGKLMSGDIAGALKMVGQAAARIAGDTINRDYIGQIGTALQSASVNRAHQRQANEAGKNTGKAVARGAADGFKDEFAKLYPDALRDVSMQMGGVNPLIPSEGISDILDAQAKLLNDNRAKDAEALQSNIDFATNAAAEIGTLIGGTFGQGVKDLAELINRDFPKLFGDLGSAFKSIAGAIDGMLGKLGTSLKTLGQGAAIGSIGASLTGGSQTGGAIGGAIGGSIGSAIAGPIGQIAGSILGGIVGGLFKKTKQASATIASIGGQAVVSTITGNNAELKGIANSMATGLLKGISSIAEQLGGTLAGAVKLSIGQRNKDFVVDPTGAGRTKGAGVINFGQDQAAAVAYATQLAIQQGIITGISAGAQTLIKAGGDLSAQVQKALQFDQVFKDLRKETDPLGASLDDLASEMMKLKAIFAEAGASAEDYAKLEELFAIKQAKVTLEANRPLRELEIQLMEAQGRAAAALAARRQLELEAMDESKRALQQQIWAAEDAAKAAEEAAKAAEQAGALAANRARLEIALMDAQGNASAALAARRQLELEGMDANLRGLQRQIWAAEDAAKANEELAAAQARSAEQAAALAANRARLEISLMDAQGRAAAALAARRELELESMDPNLRALQRQIWAAEDAAKANEELAAAQAKAAEEAKAAAEAASALALERRNLEIDLMEALGKSSEALAARRQLELNSIDASLRGLKEQIWAAQDKAIQDAAAAKAAEEAAAAQAKAAEEAANAAQRYQDALSGVTDTIRGEINRLRGITDGGSSAALKAQFALVTAQARTGNLEALGKLPELSKSIEQAAIASANSALDVSRIRAWLASSLSDTLSTQPGSDTSVSTSGAGLVFDGNKAAASNAGVQTADNINVLRFEMQNALYQIAKNTGKSTDIMNRWDGDGIPDFRDFVSNTY